MNDLKNLIDSSNFDSLHFSKLIKDNFDLFNNLSNEDQSIILNYIKNKNISSRLESSKNCSNPNTINKNFDTGLLLDNQIYFLRHNGIIYCFGKDDLDDLINTKVNPFNNQPLTDQEVNNIIKFKRNYKGDDKLLNILVERETIKEKMWKKYGFYLLLRFREDPFAVDLRNSTKLPKIFQEADLHFPRYL